MNEEEKVHIVIVSTELGSETISFDEMSNESGFYMFTLKDDPVLLLSPNMKFQIKY